MLSFESGSFTIAYGAVIHGDCLRMTPPEAGAMHVKDLLARLEDRPFKPFRIHVSDGTVLVVPEPWAILVGHSAAVVASSFERDEDNHALATRWRTVDLVHITQLSDADEKRNGRRRRRRR